MSKENERRTVNSLGSLIKSDLKSSLILAKRNILSFFLAMLGLAVLLTIAITAVSISLGLAIGSIVGSSNANLTVSNPTTWLIAGLGIFLAIIILTFAMLVLGGIYGMSKEIVEEGKSHAEKPFTTIKMKFLPLFIGSLIEVLIIIGIPLIIGGILSWAYEGTVPVILNWVSGIISLVWIFITAGLLIMVFPGIVDGKDIKMSILESIKKVKRNPARIYIVLGIFFGICIVAFLPLILWGIYYSDSGNALWISIYAPLMLVVLGLIVIPTMILTFSRIYNNLEEKPLAEL
jgi:hypothetical protein